MTTNQEEHLLFRKHSRQAVRELGFFRSQFADTGVTSAQAHILIELGQQTQLSLNEIIERLQMDKSSASRTVQRLIDKKLVKLTSHHGDQRHKLFSLTSTGQKKTEEIDKISSDLLANTLAGLTQEEETLVFDGMAAYARALRESRLRREYPLRSLRREDNDEILKVILTILQDEYQETPEEIYQMLPELKDLHSYYRNQGRHYFVVSQNGKVRGGAGIAELAEVPGKVCELQKMYLAKSVRGKGLGELLLKECLAFARKSGYLRCYLDTRSCMVAAKGLYEKYGFQKVTQPLGKSRHFICDTYYSLTL